MAKKFLLSENQMVKLDKCVKIFANLSYKGMTNGMISEKYGMSRRNLDRYGTGELDIPLSLLFHVCEVEGIDLCMLLSSQERNKSEHNVSDADRELISTQRELIDMQRDKIRQLQAELDTLKGDSVNYTTKHANAASSAENQTKN